MCIFFIVWLQSYMITQKRMDQDNLFSWYRKSTTIKVGNKYIRWANHLQQWWCTVLDEVYDSLYSDQKLNIILNWMNKTTDSYSKQVYFKLTGLWSSRQRANQPEMTENINACTLIHLELQTYVYIHVYTYILYHKKFLKNKYFSTSNVWRLYILN